MGVYYAVDNTGQLKGFAIKGSAPSDTEMERINAKLGTVAAPQEEMGPLGAGFRGVGSALRTAAAKGLDDLGFSETGKSLQDEAERIQADVQTRYHPKVPSYSDIKGIGDFGQYAYEQAAGSAPWLIAPLAGAGIGTLLGGPVGGLAGLEEGGAAALGGLSIPALTQGAGFIAADMPQYIGQNLQEQMDDNKVPLSQTSLASATGGAAVQSALDIVTPKLFGPLAGFAKILGGEKIVAPAVKKAAEKTWLNWASRLSTRTVEAMLTESGTETLQQAVQVFQADPQKLYDMPPDVRDELINSAVAGGVLGAGFGTFGHDIGAPKGRDFDNLKLAVDAAEQPRLDAAKANQVESGAAAQDYGPAFEDAQKALASADQGVRDATAARSSSIEAANRASQKEQDLVPTENQFAEKGVTITPLTSKETTFGYVVKGPTGVQHGGVHTTVEAAQAAAKRLRDSLSPTANPVIDAQFARLPLSELPEDARIAIMRNRHENGSVTDVDAPVGWEEAMRVHGKEAADLVINKLGIQEKVGLQKAAETMAPVSGVTPQSKPNVNKTPPNFSFRSDFDTVKQSPVVSAFSTPAPKIGDMVNVEVNGALVNEKPVKLRDIQEHEGKKYAFVEGSDAGVPLESVQSVAQQTPDIPKLPESKFVIREVASGVRPGSSIDSKKYPNNPHIVEQDGRQQEAPTLAKANTVAATLRKTNPDKPVTVTPKNKAFSVYETATSSNGKPVERLLNSFPSKEEANQFIHSQSVTRSLAPTMRKWTEGLAKRMPGIQDMAERRREEAAARVAAVVNDASERAGAVHDKRRAATNAMSAMLRKMGMHKAAVRFEEHITNVDSIVEGSYHAGVIKLAEDLYKPGMPLDDYIKALTGVLHHEMMHYMRDLKSESGIGLFSPTEWKALVNYAARTKAVVNGKPQSFTWMERSYVLNSHLSEDAIHEEAVAEAFRGFMNKELNPPLQPKTLFGKIIGFFKGLFALNESGGESVMRDIAQGKKSDEGFSHGWAAKLSQIGYHGTTNEFSSFKRNPNDYMLDRALGVHFAADPEIANSFVLDRVNGRDQGAKPGGHIRPVELPDDSKLLQVEQPRFDWAKDKGLKPWQARRSDQVAIDHMVMHEAFMKDPAILKRYLHEARNVPEAEAGMLADRMVAGAEVNIPNDGKYTLASFINNYAGKPYNEADRARAVELARQSWKDQGYAGLKYINTSPMENATARDSTSYVVFDPESVRSKFDAPPAAGVTDIEDKLNAGKRVSFERPGAFAKTPSKILASPLAGKPGEFQLTYFVDGNPVGHNEYASAAEAAKDAAEWDAETTRIKSLQDAPPAANVSDKDLNGPKWSEIRLSAARINPAHLDTLRQKMMYGAAADMMGQGLRFVGIKGERAISAQNAYDHFLQIFADKMLPVGRLIDAIRKVGSVPDFLDTYQRYELLRGVTGDILRVHKERFYDPLIQAVHRLNYNKADIESLRRTAPEFAEFAAEAKDVKMGLAQAHVAARHAQERNAKMRLRNPEISDPNTGIVSKESNDSGSGFKDEEAARAMAWFNARPDKALNDQMLAKFDALIKSTNDTRVEKHLTPDFTKLKPTNDEIPYEYYAPIRGIREEDADEDNATETQRVGRGLKIRGLEDMHALGRGERPPPLVFEHAILQNMQSVIRGEKNMVAQSLVKLLRSYEGKTIDFQGKPVNLNDLAQVVEQVPLQRKLINGIVKTVPNQFYMNEKEMVVAKMRQEDGSVQQVAVNIKNEALRRALTSENGLGSGTAGQVVNTLGKVTQFMAKMSTQWNPIFLLTNFPRDLGTAFVNLQQYEIDKLPTTVMKGVKDAFLTVYKSSPHRSASYVKDGTETASRVHVSKDGTNWTELYDRFRAAGGDISFWGLTDINELQSDINHKLFQDEKNGLTKGIAAFKRFGEYVEAHNKAVESATRLSTFKALLDAGLTEEMAAQGAKNVTVNFDKGGTAKPFMNPLYMFYNAGVQGSMAILSAIARSKRVRKVIGGIVAAGVMQDLVMSMIAGDDDKGDNLYDQIPDYILEHNMVFLNPSGDGTFIKIPMPYGYNAFHNMGRSIARLLRGRYSVGQALGTGAGALVDAFNPMGGTSSFLAFASPTITDPIVELSLNKDWSDRPIYQDSGSNGEIRPPASQRHWNNTSQLSIGITDFMHKLTGGTDMFPGAVELSPDILDYVFRYYGAGVGALVGQASNFTTKTIPDILVGDTDDLAFKDVPVVSKLVGNVTSQADTTKYFEIHDQAMRARKELDAAVKAGDVDGIRAAQQQHPALLALSGQARALDAARSSIARKIKLIQANPRLSDDQKRAIVQPLKDRQHEVERNLIRSYNTSVRDGQ